MARNGIDTRRAVEAAVGLRRARRTATADARADIDRALDVLEDAVGPTLSRADAARILGVSHTALNRWVAKRDIPAVITPTGRREIPLSQVVDLLDAMGEHSDLTELIRERRRRAAAISSDALVRDAGLPAGHRAAELRGLAYHRLVADRLDERLVADAERRLERWERSGSIDPRWVESWREILGQPLPQIAARISADDETGRTLRQSSPFAGTLNEQERRRVLEAVGG